MICQFALGGQIFQCFRLLVYGSGKNFSLIYAKVLSFFDFQKLWAPGISQSALSLLMFQTIAWKQSFDLKTSPALNPLKFLIMLIIFYNWKTIYTECLKSVKHLKCTSQKDKKPFLVLHCRGRYCSHDGVFFIRYSELSVWLNFFFFFYCSWTFPHISIYISMLWLYNGSVLFYYMYHLPFT